MTALESAGADIDVVVSDDGANSAASVVAAFPWSRRVVGPRQGRSANRNAGARNARGAWLLFIDDDVIPGDGLLRGYLDAIQLGGADVLEGQVTPDRPRSAFNEICPINLEGGALWSCNFAIRRELFEGVGGFDEAYVRPGLEDTDLRLRLAEYGARTIFVPTATVCHPWRTTDLREMFARFGNMEMFLDRHPDEARTLNSRRFARGAGHALKDLSRNLVRYRARGAPFQLGSSVIAVIIAARLWRRAHRPAIRSRNACTHSNGGSPLDCGQMSSEP